MEVPKSGDSALAVGLPVVGLIGGDHRGALVVQGGCVIQRVEEGVPQPYGKLHRGRVDPRHAGHLPFDQLQVEQVFFGGGGLFASQDGGYLGEDMCTLLRKPVGVRLRTAWTERAPSGISVTAVESQ